MLRYVRAMSNDAMNSSDDSDPLNGLRAELAQGDQSLAGVAPVLVHLLSQSGQSLVSDQMVALMRGMLSGMASELLEQLDAEPGGQSDQSDLHHALVNALSNNTQLLSHCFANSIEAQISQRLERDLHMDQVLSPLLQELIASTDQELAELAMNVMAAQARFVQAQTRMRLPLSELPADLFRLVLMTCQEVLSRESETNFKQASAKLTEGFDEASGRPALLSRLTIAMRGGANAALNIEHGGVALFASALAQITKQPRELAIIGCSDRQHARLALGLRAASQSYDRIEQVMAIVHPQVDMSPAFANLTPQAAKTMLSKSSAGTVR
ncbi:MAG: hypothetical protein ABJ239_11380 [Erythrobacter sp.]